MTAAMNASLNVSVPDGWIPEFASHGHNSFIIPPADPAMPLEEQDRLDMERLYAVLENEILPLYYDRPEGWLQTVQRSMREVVKFFDSGRMAREYYEAVYRD